MQEVPTTARTPSSRAKAEDAAVQLEREMAEILRERIGYREPFASSIAAEIVAGLRERRGGDDMYVPAPDKRARDAEIRRIFNGSNLEEVMRLFGVSQATVYRATGRRPR